MGVCFGERFKMRVNINDLVKSQESGGTVKSSRCKARESLGMRRTYQYVAMTKDEAQRCRWTFYEAVNINTQPAGDIGNVCNKGI
jgi:hypothetical protein